MAVLAALVILLGLEMVGLRYGPYLLAAVSVRSTAPTLVSDIRTLQLGDLDHATLDELSSRVLGLRANVALLRHLMVDDPLIALARSTGTTPELLAHGEALLAAADDLGTAGSIALDLGDQFITVRDTAAASGHSPIPGLLELVSTSTADIDRAADATAHARALLATIPDDAQAEIARFANLMRGSLDSYGPLLDGFRAVSRVLPGIVGWHSDARYLVLAQDPAELRPAGGYTGTVGIVRFQDGLLTERSFDDVYRLDLKPGVPFVEPPEALANHLLTGGSSWQLADATWSADFPTAAQKALQLYSLESGDSNVDGVIAITTDALDRLLLVTGPVEVPDYGVTVHPGDVTLTTLALTRGVSTPTSTRKAFLDELAGTIIDRIYALPPQAWPELVQAFEDIADQRLMLTWFKDPAAEALVAGSSIGGAVRQDAGDYVYVVEANLAPTSKYNLVVDRRDTLGVTLATNGDATNMLRLDWQNNAMAPGEPYASIRSYSTSTSGIYGAYVRVYTPGTSGLMSTAGMGLDPINAVESEGQEAGRNAFGNFLLIAPGPADLAYSWATPGVATQTPDGLWEYSLTIQKQPGLRPMPLAVTVQLPAGATVDSVSDGATADSGTVVFATTLTTDAQVQIRYRLP